MRHDLFYRIDTGPERRITPAVRDLREAGFAVTGDYDEDVRALNPDPDAPPGTTEIALAILPQGVTGAAAIEAYADDIGVRLATLAETAAFARAHPEVFEETGCDVAVIGDPLAIAGDPETWVPVFPAAAPRSLCVAPRSDSWDAARVPVVRI